jgi:DeoR family fructose operon transcriptional repressor
MSSSDTAPRRLPAGRKAELAAYVTETGEVTVAQLADRFDVSADTIRRDLDQLDADGVLVRTHGGAVGLSTAPRPNTELDVRMRMQTQAKERIGGRAAALVRDGQAIIVNAGTTTLALIRALGERRDLTVATNSLRGATELAPSAYRAASRQGARPSSPRT